MAVLKVLKGSCPGQIVELRGERMVFGRHPNCQIVLDNAAVSRHHAQILESHGNFYLEDLRSRNGTQLNDSPIEGRTELRESDEVKVCDFVFRFHLSVPPDDPPAVPPEAIKPKSSKPYNDDSFRGTLPLDENESRIYAAAATRIHDDAQDEPDSDGGSDSDRSSIISTLNVSSSTGLRLGVKPEIKLRAVLEISNSLGQTLETDEVLAKILDGLFKIFPQADEGFVLLKDEVRQKLIVKASKTRLASRQDAVPISMTIVRQAMESGEAILSADAADDSRFDSSESLSNLRIRSMICAPLVGKSGVALGVIQITTADVRLQFSQDDLDLLISVASQGSLALENASLHEGVMKQRDFERELEFANQVQLGFLPNERPKLVNYEFADYYEAAQSVGGDYFDYVPLPGGKYAVALADVAGKGVPAALLMARLYSSARYHLLTKPNVAAALVGLNGEIASSGLGHRFITCVLAVIDPKNHVLTLANAGHLPPLRRDAAGAVETIAQKESGMPLGILPDQKFRKVEYDFRPGDSWIMFTDGVTEAMNPHKEIFGSERLAEYFSGAPQDAGDFVKGIIAEVENFGAGEAQRDDICLVGFRRMR